MTTELIRPFPKTAVTAAAGAPARRDPAWDALRGLTILIVVTGHSVIAGFPFAFAEEGRWNFQYSLVIRQFQVFAVPLFLFISGYLVGHARFDVPGSYRQFLGRRMPRILIPYTLWSLVFITLYLYLDRRLTPGDFLLRFLIGGGDGPFYFIVVLAQLYLLTPLLVRVADRTHGLVTLMAFNMAFLLALNVARYSFFSADHYAGMPVYIYYSFPCFTWITHYTLGLHYRRHPGSESVLPARLLLAAVAATWLLMTVEAFTLYRMGHVEMATSTIRLGCYVYSVAVIVALFRLRTLPWPRFFVICGEYTFGIFFIHMFILRIVERFLQPTPLYMYQPIYQAITFTVVLAACFAMIIPVRRLIGNERAAKWLGF